MKKTSLAIVALSTLALASCSLFGGGASNGENTSSSSSVRETRNVLYRGTLEEIGVSIYMEGTHRLNLEDGRFILLESSEVDLADYEGHEVEVIGAIRPTVEEGGTIMRVETITRTDISSSSSSMSSEEASSSMSSEALSSAATTSTPKSSTPPPPPPASSKPASSAAVIPTSSEGSTIEGSAAVTAMLKANLDAANWTQKYCSTHMKFCFLVHKNWYYVSFGAAAGAVWHVEVSAAELENVGDGPLSVNVMAGSIDASEDGQVAIQGDSAVGYRTWPNGMHIEVRAPVALQAAVRYITASIRASE